MMNNNYMNNNHIKRDRRAKHKSTDNLYENARLDETQRIHTLVSENNSEGTYRILEESRFKKLKRMRSDQEWSPQLVETLIEVISPHRDTDLIELIIFILEKTMGEIFKMKNEINCMKQKQGEFEQQIWNLKRQKKRLETNLNRLKEEQTQYNQTIYTMKEAIQELKEKERELIEFIVKHNLKKISHTNSRIPGKFNNQYSDEQADISLLDESSVISSIAEVKPIKKQTSQKFLFGNTKSPQQNRHQ